VRVRVVVLDEPDLLQRGCAGELLSLGLCHPGLLRRKHVTPVGITVHLHNALLQAEVVGLLLGLALQDIVVRCLSFLVLLVVLPLGVKELLQDLGKGFNLVRCDVLGEVIRLPELLVELTLGLLQDQGLLVALRVDFQAEKSSLKPCIAVRPCLDAAGDAVKKD